MMNKEIEVSLDWREVVHAGYVGVERWVNAVAKKRDPNDDPDSKRDLVTTAGHHIIGAIGECGFAKWSGRYWSKELNLFKTPDVCGSEVKTTELYGLIVRMDAKNYDTPYVMVRLVNVLKPVLCGWEYCRNLRQDKFLVTSKSGHKYYLANKRFLQPMSTFPFKSEVIDGCVSYDAEEIPQQLLAFK